jgi:spermidine synthase
MDKVTVPEGQKGEWRIERFTVDRPDFHSMLHGRSVPMGETFTRLKRGSTLVMSDTPAEMRDHTAPVRKATGSCLINGLGIGMVLQGVLAKDTVTDVTVVEISQDLIDLVAPHYATSRLTVICADALEYMPPKGKRYQMVWHDIWDDICSDNLEEMAKLHRKYGRRADWQGSWAKELCQRYR